MNHQRFKFYHHSTDYYRQLYSSIKQLEESCKEVNYEVLPSTINYKRNQVLLKGIVILISLIRKYHESELSPF